MRTVAIVTSFTDDRLVDTVLRWLNEGRGVYVNFESECYLDDDTAASAELAIQDNLEEYVLKDFGLFIDQLPELLPTNDSIMIQDHKVRIILSKIELVEDTADPIARLDVTGWLSIDGKVFSDTI